MSTTTTNNLTSEDLRRVRQELWTNLQNIDTRLKQTYVPSHFRITTSSTNSQRTFSTNNNNNQTSSNDSPNPLKRSRVSSSSYDEHNNSSLPENNNDEYSSSKSLHSSIVPTNKIIKTKDDLISLVNRDQQSAGRDRRMFGVLLGTLNKFKAEARAYSEQSTGLKRQEIERRLEEKQAKEREDKQHERTELIASKRSYQQQLKLVNEKLQLMQQLSNREKHHEFLRNFIRTKTKPYVFYLPKGTLNEQCESKLQESQTELEKEFEEFKRDCQQKLDALEDTTNLNNLTINHDDDDDDERISNSKKHKPNETDDDDDDDDNADDALDDLPDEITLSAPEVKSEIKSSANEQANKSSRTVIYDETKLINESNDQ